MAIVGPTASGKSALALRAAEALGGEIVSADSRQVYRGMDIGTAKPTREERERVPHHLIDVADPGERYDVFRYQRDARRVLDEIASRGRAAVVVGGTGLYVRALLDGLDLASVPTDPLLRAKLEATAEREGGDALHARLRDLDPEAAARVDPRNVRRVVRYVEAAMLTGGLTASWRRDAAVPAVKIGLAPPREILIAAIETRVRRMVDAGVLDETRALLARGLDPTVPSLSGHGYIHWTQHLAGALTLDEAIQLTVRDTRRYSRRQMTWFRRDGGIRWIDPTAVDPLPATLSG
ncbi:MAG: tRNA (adenosine(37)-N6)-dimethylallyltransferase MiaA [Chloroflexota bacterium]